MGLGSRGKWDSSFKAWQKKNDEEEQRMGRKGHRRREIAEVENILIYSTRDVREGNTRIYNGMNIRLTY